MKENEYCKLVYETEEREPWRNFATVITCIPLKVNITN